MKVIIAEKPSVAREIGAIVGATTRKEGYLEGNGYAVTWAFGHLVGLVMPEAYGFKGFQREHLPILPKTFILQPRQVKEGKEYKADPGTVKQLNIIQELFAKCERIIVATDAGREGCLIFRYIYNYLNCHKPFDRLWISSLTDRAIREGLQNLKPGRDYDNLYYAAKARSEADWLVGINASQALSLAAGSGVFSLGRVQTPTLAMICSRYLENKDFKPQTYFQLKLHTAKDATTFSAISTNKYDTRNQVDELYTLVSSGNPVTVVSVERKEANQEPPLLYDLTTLQKEANTKYSFSADKTLTITQALYEKKVLSYPRTGSRYLSEDVFVEIPALLEKLQTINGYESLAQLPDRANLNKNSVNAAKVTDHHALLPTGIEPVGLNKEEKTLFHMIATRMVEAFMPPCLKEVTKAEGLCMNLSFSTKNVAILSPGWREVLKQEEERKPDDDTVICQSNPLSGVSNGDKLPISGVTLLSRKTSPPPLYTEGTLLSAMETAGKDLEDDEQRERLKDLGIGTPATRASIIETLYKRQYIEKKGKSIVPTERGLYVFEAVKNMQISDVEMTGSWEKSLHDIENGEMLFESFMEAIKIHTRQVTSEILTISIPSSGQTGYACPKCGTGLVQIREKTAKCNSSDCGFILYRTIASKRLTDSVLIDLIGKKKTKLLKGFKSKAKGTSFDAKLYLDDNFQLQMEFPPRKNNSSHSKK